MKLIDAAKLTKQNIDIIFKWTKIFLTNSNDTSLDGVTLCNYYFQSKNSRVFSFETAMKKLGGKVVAFKQFRKGTNADHIDTLTSIEQRAKIMVLYDSEKTFLSNYAVGCNKTLINGGSRNDEHPVQILLDVYMIQKYFNIETDPIKILIVGDITNNIPIQSLVKTLSQYNKIVIEYFLYNDENTENRVQNYDTIQNYDVVYMTHIQPSDHDFDMTKYKLTNEVVSKMKDTTIILHELTTNDQPYMTCDPSSSYKKNDRHQCKYNEQLEHLVYIQMAVLYCLHFKQLDSSFYTLGYNYRDQLRSEIHSW